MNLLFKVSHFFHDHQVKHEIIKQNPSFVHICTICNQTFSGTFFVNFC